HHMRAAATTKTTTARPSATANTVKPRKNRPTSARAPTRAPTRRENQPPGEALGMYCMYHSLTSGNGLSCGIEPSPQLPGFTCDRTAVLDCGCVNRGTNV